jgi:MFS family permease
MKIFSIYDELPPSVRPTYFYTIRSAIVGALAGGIASLLGNIAVSNLHASQWDMAVMTSMEGAGMLLAFFWGGFTAGRRKMPFVFWPAVLSGSIFFLLGLVKAPTVFCLLVGLMGLIGNVGAPARAGIVGSNMPASVRGLISGFTQRWAILVGVTVAVAGAEIIQHQASVYRWILPLGGVFAILSALIFLRIRVRGEKRLAGGSDPSPFAAFHVLARDKFFRTYMVDFFLFGLGNLLTMPIVLIVLRDDMHADFRQIQWTTVIIPAVMGLATVGFWGRVLDKSNPVSMRAWMNMVWLALPLGYYLAPRHPVMIAGFSIHPVDFIWIGAVVQGSIAAGQGLIWMLGATYFARKEDVPLYQGVHIGLTGIRALAGPFLGTFMVDHLFGGGMEARRSLFLVSFFMMVTSALLLFRLSARIRREFGGRMPGSGDKGLSAGEPRIEDQHSVD